jgi:hypothetical protein
VSRSSGSGQVPVGCWWVGARPWPDPALWLCRSETVERLSVLRTKAMREKEEQRELRKYTYTLLRVRLPDGCLLQGGPGSRAGDLRLGIEASSVLSSKPSSVFRQCPGLGCLGLRI